MHGHHDMCTLSCLHTFACHGNAWFVGKHAVTIISCCPFTTASLGCIENVFAGIPMFVAVAGTCYPYQYIHVGIPLDTGWCRMAVVLCVCVPRAALSCLSLTVIMYWAGTTWTALKSCSAGNRTASSSLCSPERKTALRRRLRFGKLFGFTFGFVSNVHTRC